MQVGGTLRPDALKGRIDLENVSFRYPTRGTCVLDNFSLKISPGEVVALVGPSGSGKSSIIKLIERLYDPEKGQLSLDGTSICGNLLPPPLSLLSLSVSLRFPPPPPPKLTRNSLCVLETTTGGGWPERWPW